MQRLRRSSSIFANMAIPSLKRKASNSWSAIQETYLSTKDIFERHRVVFTISTSIASALTAMAGYSLRYYHQSKVEQRLASIEEAISTRHVEQEEIKKIVSSGTVSTAACVATAGTTLIIGYGLGWRGGRWYANRKFRKEQLKLLGQVKPSKWQMLHRRLVQSRASKTAHRTSEILGEKGTALLGSHQAHPS